MQLEKLVQLHKKRINPDDVIIAYESDDPTVMKYLYQQAKKLKELQDLYKKLCFEYYTKDEEIPIHSEDVNNRKPNIKK